MKNMLPVVSVRNFVVVPDTVSSIFVSRTKSLASIEHALKLNSRMVVVSQKKPEIDFIDESSSHLIGTLVNVQSVVRMPNGIAKVIVEGLEAVTIEKFKVDDALWCSFKLRKWTLVREGKVVLRNSIVEQLDELRKSDKRQFEQIDIDYSDFTLKKLIYFVINDLRDFNLDERIAIYLAKSEKTAAEKTLKLLESRLTMVQTSQSLRKKIKDEISKSQKEFFLNEQIKAAEKELGRSDRTDKLLQKIKKANLPEEAAAKATEEFERLREMPSNSMEASMLVNYIETLINMPWNVSTTIESNLKEARVTLDTDHYGIEKVKESILNYMAVQNRTGKIQGSILCLVGPPGVGKTSLAASIARSTGRKYVRMALGGMTDEAEIRGHRRTYVGSMCGRIMKKLEQSKANNPLFLLDEIDKVGSSWRGDPTSALLEVLDPEQNKFFVDNYLEVPFDLSNVFFLCTANTMNIHPALLDRMDIIELSSYNRQEKLNIAKNYLIPQQMKLNGLAKREFSVSNNVLDHVIKSYTKEAGVRNLSRAINKLARAVVRKNDEAEIVDRKSIKLEFVRKTLGAPIFEDEERNTQPVVGKVNGLAWTQSGGELLPIEVVAIENGTGKIQTTGSLGKVMEESIKAAVSLARTRIGNMPVIKGFPDKIDLHVHMPAGAIPKDGPSAGLGMTIAIISAICQLPANNLVAVTGEISLLGNVLKIGGLKEKLLAANAEGIKTVIVPKSNLVEVEDIKSQNSVKLAVIGVESIDSVWEHFFDSKLSKKSFEGFNKKRNPKLVLNNSNIPLESGKIFTDNK